MSIRWTFRDAAPLGRALNSLRDHVAAPGTVLSAACLAFCLDVVPKAALSDDPQIAASLLRPCLGVLCKVASSPDNETVIKWLQKESGRLPRESGPWRSLSRFSRPTDLRSAFEKWKGPPAKHWWLQALTGSNEACRRQASLLLLAACGNEMETPGQTACVEFALESFAAACASNNGDVSQLVVVAKELITSVKRRTYIQKRGFGRCCARLARREASLLLARDARLLRDARGGADGAAARAVGRESPALEALCVLASELAEPDLKTTPRALVEERRGTP